jgi:methyl-accepting chemotaxis protein
MKHATLFDRVGILTRLLLPVLILVPLGIAGIVTWTLGAVRDFTVEREQASLDVGLAVLRQTLAHATGTPGRPDAAVWSVESDQLRLGGVVLNGRNDIVDTVRKTMGSVATLFMADLRVATNVTNPDGSRAVGTRLAPGPVYDAVLRRGQQYRGPATILGERYLAIYDPIRDRDNRVIGVLFTGVPRTTVDALFDQIASRSLVGAGVLLVLLAAVLSGWVGWCLRPITALARTMVDMTQGRLDGALPCLHRSDRLGLIARALRELRETLIHGRHVEAEAARARVQAAQDRGHALTAMANRVEQDLSVALQEVTGRSTSLSRIADTMGHSADRSGEGAQRATDAAGGALETARSAASASALLSGAIDDVARQVAHSTEVVAQAVSGSEHTRRAIETLTDRVGRIGDMTRIIADIAARTNLLALNATIEAARAGEAGRGFAVVAGEVKQLATQTAQSTGEITRQIEDVREATGEAVAAVRRIESTISEIDAIAASVAASVEQQGAATGAIASSIEATAEAAQEVCRNIDAVRAEADMTRLAAGDVRSSATSLSGSIAALQQGLMTVVRASVGEAA